MPKKIEVTGILCLNQSDPYEPTGVQVYDPDAYKDDYIKEPFYEGDKVIDLADVITRYLGIPVDCDWKKSKGKKAKITIELCE